MSIIRLRFGWKDNGLLCLEPQILPPPGNSSPSQGACIVSLENSCFVFLCEVNDKLPEYSGQSRFGEELGAEC